MLVGGLGIEINQLTGHHQMTRNNVTVGTRQGRQRAHSITVKLLGTHASRNRRLIAVRRHVLVSRRIVLVGDIIAPLILTRPATVALKTAALTSVTAQASATVITTLEATTAAPAVITVIVTAPKIAALEITLAITTETATTVIKATATVIKATATVITTLEATTITPAIITTTKITTLTIATLEITLTVTTETTTIVTTLVTASTIITTLEATTITPAIITTTKITTLTITTLVTATIIIAFPPLGLTLRVITTAESAASLSLFCHGA